MSENSRSSETAKRVVIFGSGRGSNAKSILSYFQNREDIAFPLIVSNNSNAGIFELADEFGIEKMIFFNTFVVK